MTDFPLSIWQLLIILALVLAWLYGVWKALRYTRRLIHWRTDGQAKQIESIEQAHWSFVQILFYLSNILIFSGLMVRLLLSVDFYGLATLLGAAGYVPLIGLTWYCEFHSEVEPKLIDLSINHELTTRPRYEEVLIQARGIWVFEHPIFAFLGMVFTLSGACLAWVLQDNDFLFLAGFGVHLLIFAYAYGGWTILTVRTNSVTLKRWLTVPAVIHIPRTEIQDVHIDQTILHSIWNGSHLILTSEHLSSIEIVSKNASLAKTLIENPPVQDLQESESG